MVVDPSQGAALSQCPGGTVLPLTQTRGHHSTHTRHFGALQALRRDITQKDFKSRAFTLLHMAQTGELTHLHPQEFTSPRTTAFHRKPTTVAAFGVCPVNGPRVRWCLKERDCRMFLFLENQEYHELELPTSSCAGITSTPQPPAGGHLGAEHLIKGSQPFNPSFLSLRFYEADTRCLWLTNVSIQPCVYWKRG